MFTDSSRCIVIVGAQWGDEGKGKITDVLAEQATLVARYQGGANAGHTVLVNGEEFIPAAIEAGAVAIVTRPQAAVEGAARIADAEPLGFRAKLWGREIVESRQIHRANSELVCCSAFFAESQSSAICAFRDSRPPNFCSPRMRDANPSRTSEP
mgnify:CR=1 FL=1